MSRRAAAAATAALAAAASGGLAGCVSLIPEGGPPPQIYRLSPPAAEPVPGPAARRPWTVEVATPTAPRALAADRIAVSPDGAEIAFAAGARWSEPTPQLLQSVMVNAFDADGRVLAAVRPEDGVRASCDLRLEIEAFEAVYLDGEDAPPTVAIRVRARLINPSTRTLTATSVFEVMEPADEARLRAIVASFETAVQAVASTVVDWTLDNGGVITPGAGPACAAVSSAGGE